MNVTLYPLNKTVQFSDSVFNISQKPFALFAILISINLVIVFLLITFYSDIAWRVLYISRHRIFKSRQQHQCNFCKEVYTSKETLTEHLRNNHYNQIFHCDICNEYKDQKDLIVHMTQHALNSLQPSQDQQQPNQPQTKSTKPKNKSIISTTGNNKLKCKKCDKIFASLNGVRYHMNSVHAKLKNFKCDKCEKAFSCKRVLDNHMKSIHIKKKVFQCDLCEKAFKTDAALYTHKKIHDNVFPYECDKCGKTFRFKHHHVSHLEIHNMVKKYACNICSKQFYAQNNLSKHMKTHETTLEYTCHLCNVKMNQRRYLYEHMKRVHQPVLNKDNSNWFVNYQTIKKTRKTQCH